MHAATIWSQGGRANRLHVVMKTEHANTTTNFKYILIYILYMTGMERDTVVIYFFSIFIDHEFDDKTTINEGDKVKK